MPGEPFEPSASYLALTALAARLGSGFPSLAREQRVEALAAQYAAGKYEVDAFGLAKCLVDRHLRPK